MINANEGKLLNLNALATTNATSSHAISFDTKGYDYLNLYVACGSHNSATQGITSIAVSEHDTTTSASSQTTIAGLSSATEASTSATNVLPAAATMALGGIANALQVDLRKRKRYLGVVVKADSIAAGMPISVVGILSRSKQSADTAAQKAGKNLAATNYSGCMAVISA